MSEPVYEILSVPAYGNPVSPSVSTSFDTVPGKSYTITVSGTIVYGPDFSPPWIADGIYAWSNWDGWHLSGVVRLLIDETVLPALPLNSAHSYQFIWQGTGDPFVFRFADSQSSNNSGSLSVSVSELLYDGSGNGSDCMVYQASDQYSTWLPVSLRLGEVRDALTDLSVNSPAGMLAFTRYYRQSKQTDEQFRFMGLGWTHNHHLALVARSGSPRSILLFMPNGGVATFVETTTDHYPAAPGSTSFIDWNSSTSQYELTSGDNSIYLFDSAGTLLSRTWPNSESWSYTYTSNKLTEVADDYGRKLQFSYVSNPGQFDDGQLWRVGDQSASGLSGSTPSGRYIEFGYMVEKLDGATTATPYPLLFSVRDVRGNVSTYDWYGQHSGESASNQKNFLTRHISPLLDTNGDGSTETAIISKNFSYTVSGTTITGITEKNGALGTSPALLETVLAFQPNGQNITTETIAGKTTTHYFTGGLYRGSELPGNNGKFPVQDYDNAYRPAQQTDANGNPTQLGWSPDGKLLNQVTDALNNKTAFTYNTNDTLQSSVDAQGRTTQYTYADTNNPRQPTRIQVYDVDGQTILRWQEFTYDNKGRALTETVFDPKNPTAILQQVTRDYYTSGDGNGLLHRVIQKDVGGGDDVITTYTYDGAGRVTKTQQSSNFGSCAISFSVFDAAGNVVATLCNYDPGSNADPTTVAQALALYNPRDPNKNRVTTYEYDPLGRRIKTTTDAAASFAMTTLTVYDALNRVVRTISNYVASPSVPEPYIASRNVFPHGANNDQNLVTDTVYNARGMVKRQIDVLGNITLYGYDDAGRLVKTVQSASQVNYNNDYTDAASDPSLARYIPGNRADQDIITTQAYDANGNLVKSTDVLGNVTLTGYDPLNRPVKTVRSTSQPNYDITTDPTLSRYLVSTAPDQDLIDTTEYDALGRVIRTRRLLENRPSEQWDTTLYGYDGLGRQVRVIRSASQPNYNLTNDPSLSNYPISDNADQDIVTQTAYDASGRVLYTEDALGNRTWSAYDGLGRQVKTIVNPMGSATDGGVHDPRSPYYNPVINVADRDLISTTTYDSDGRVMYTQDVLGRRNWPIYDDLGRTVKSVTNASGNATDGGIHDPRSPVYARSINTDQDVIAQTVYDTQGRVSATFDTRGNQTRYEYDRLGRRIKTIINFENRIHTPSAKMRFSFAADIEWANTNVTVHAGESLFITASGYVKPWSWWPDPGIGPNGDASWPTGAGTGVLIIDDPFCELVGRIGISGTPFRVGAYYQGLASSSGTLYLAINDVAGGFSDNVGSFDTYIRISASDETDIDRISETVYDLAGRVVSRKDAAGIETRYEYDALGRRTKTITNYVDGRFNPNVTDEDLISTTTYNRAGQVVATTDARGTQSTFTYDRAGRRLTVIQAAGTPLATTSYTCYDKAGRVVRTIQNYVPQYNSSDQLISPDAQNEWGNWLFAPTYNGLNNDTNLITRFAYDRSSRQIVVTDPLGNATLTTYYRDGQVNTLTDPEGMVTVYRYDALRRRTRVIQSYVANGEDPARWYWNGSWKRGDGTAIAHGTNNDQNIIVDVAYDQGGRVVSMRDPLGSLTTYTYDGLDRRTALVNPINQTWLTAYFNLDFATRTVMTYPGVNGGSSYTVQRDFDRLGRLATLSYGDPATTPDVKMTYDTAGNRIKMTEYSGAGFTTPVRETQYSYDDLHRLTQAAFDTDGSGSIDESVSYAYDAGGLRTQMTLPGSLSMTYAYNAKGQLVGMTDWDGQYTQMLYDNVGRRVATIRQNGLSSHSEYDAGGRLFRLTHHERNKVLARFIFKLDRRGNKTQAAEQLARPASTVQTIGISDPAVSYYKGTWNTVGSYKVTTQFSSAMTITFTGNEAVLTMGTGTDHGIYDIYIDGSLWESFDGYSTSGIDRLINIYLDKGGSHTIDIQNRAEKNKNSSGYSLRFKQLDVLSTTYDIQTIDYTYDALARLLTANYSGLTPTQNYTYAYDRSGNRTQQIVNIGGTPTTTDYEYLATNAIQRSRVNGGAWTNFSYDNNGNMRSDGTNTHTWNRANRLTSLGSTSYIYDGEGHRVQQTVGANVTKYLLDLQPGLSVVLSETTGANITRYVHGAMGVQARKDPMGNWFWSLQDALGSVRSEVSSATAIQGMRHFDPIGNAFGLQGSFSGMPYEFTGESKDSDGLLYLRERYLNTQLGVFTRLDPFEGLASRPMSLNGYSWVEGNLPNAIDPSGRSSIAPMLSGLCGTPFQFASYAENDSCTANQYNGVNILVATATTETDNFGPLTYNDEAVFALMLFQLNYFSALADWKLLGTWKGLGIVQTDLRIANPPVVGIGGTKYDANFKDPNRVTEMKWMANRAIAGHCEGDALRYFSNLTAKELYPQIYAKVDALRSIANNPNARSEVSINATRKEQFEGDSDYLTRYVVRAGSGNCDRAIVIGDSDVESAWIEYQCPTGYNAIVGTEKNPDELGTLQLGVNVSCKACNISTRQWWGRVDGAYKLLSESDFQSRNIDGYVASCEGTKDECR